MVKFLLQRPIAVLMAFTACFYYRAGDVFLIAGVFVA